MDAIKADRALRACLETIEASPRPVAAVGSFLEDLSRNKQWTDKEIAEFQMLVIKTIVERWRGSDA